MKYITNFLLKLAEQGKLPDPIVRFGINLLNRKRLFSENLGDPEKQQAAKNRFIELMRQSPAAVNVDAANEQHYEVPADFFKEVLGVHMKYSACYWFQGAETLDEAEAAMLDLTCRRAEIEDGMDILELGCGWGSLSLWMAEHFPDSRITAVSNSHSQRMHIESFCKKRGIVNLNVITKDMNDFDAAAEFDRIVSVEMFEHMRNWPLLLDRISGWLKPEGKVFIHVFSHREHPYLYEIDGPDDWMGRHFFTGGMMPSDDLILYLQNRLKLEKHWQVSGVHYEKTANAWLQQMDSKKETVMTIMEEVYGRNRAEKWFHRWRIFFMACAELWGFRNGREWLVSHYRLSKR